MTISVFCDKYGLHKDTLYVAKADGRIHSGAFLKARGEHIHVDENYFVRRKEFRKRVKAFNQSMYYFLNEFFTPEVIGREIAKHFGGKAASITQYMRDQLFRLDDGTILSTKVGVIEWRVFRYNRKVVGTLNKKFNIKFDVEYILDRRMYEN